jgi:hypothetical protein
MAAASSLALGQFRSGVGCVDGRGEACAERPHRFGQLGRIFKRWQPHRLWLWDKSVRVWDALTGEEKHVLNGHTDSVNSVAFSSDGSRVVSGSNDKSVRVWGKSMQDRVSRYTREKIAQPTHGLEFTGWLLSPRGGEYIMFVPPGERLPDDANILTIPHSFIAYVDFTESRLGPEWGSCYSP